MKDLSNDVEYMKQYLKHALEMEVHKYTWEEALEEAKSKRAFNEDTQKSLKNAQIDADRQVKSINVQFDFTKNDLAAENNAAFMQIVICSLLIIASILIIRITVPINGNFIMLMLPLTPVVIVCIVKIINRIIRIVRNIGTYNDITSKNALANQQQIISAIQKSKKDAAANLVQAEKLHPVLVQTQQKVYSELKVAQENLDKIYSNNVLPVKYRNLVAVATLYGYLENKQCNYISGHGGIYDTYEHDCQLQIIHRSLNEIKNELIEIKRAVNNVYEAQFYLYEELTNANEHLKDIKKEIGSIRQSSDIAAENSAISAEASRQSADMLNWWNWTRKF